MPKRIMLSCTAKGICQLLGRFLCDTQNPKYSGFNGFSSTVRESLRLSKLDNDIIKFGIILPSENGDGKDKLRTVTGIPDDCFSRMQSTGELLVGNWVSDDGSIHLDLGNQDIQDSIAVGAVINLVTEEDLNFPDLFKFYGSECVKLAFDFKPINCPSHPDGRIKLMYGNWFPDVADPYNKASIEFQITEFDLLNATVACGPVTKVSVDYAERVRDADELGFAEWVLARDREIAQRAERCIER